MYNLEIRHVDFQGADLVAVRDENKSRGPDAQASETKQFTKNAVECTGGRAMPSPVGRELFRVAGFCTNCGRNPPREGLKTCQACADRYKSYYAKQQAKRKETGLCVRCGKPAVEGRTLCEYCAEKSHVSQLKYYKLKVMKGLCARCGQSPARPGKKYCEQCADLQHQWYLRKKEHTKEVLSASARSSKHMAIPTSS